MATVAGSHHGAARRRAPAAVVVATREEKARRRAEMLLVAAAAAAALGQRTRAPVAPRAAAAACAFQSSVDTTSATLRRLIDGVELHEGVPHRLISTQAATVDPYPSRPTRAAVARLGAAEEAELARREEHREGRGHRAARPRL